MQTQTHRWDIYILKYSAMQMKPLKKLSTYEVYIYTHMHKLRQWATISARQVCLLIYSIAAMESNVGGS